MRLPTIAAAMSAAMLLTAAAPQAQDGTDAFLHWQALEPVLSKGCASRDCTPRDGGLAPFGRAPNSIYGVASDWKYRGVTLTYAFLDCKPDQRGCKTANFFASYLDKQPAEPAIAAARARHKDCSFSVDNDRYLGKILEVHIRIPLTKATTSAQLRAARTKLEACLPPV